MMFRRKTPYEPVTVMDWAAIIAGMVFLATILVLLT